MVSVEEAKSILLNAVVPLEGTLIDATNALGCVLAEDIYAPVNLPPFDQSNVDGYAVCLSSLGNDNWNVVMEIKAGDYSEIVLNEGEAVRIFTGAMVPAGSDMVIMQEKINRTGNMIQLAEALELKKGEHIRLSGSQIKKGTLALSRGVLCTPSVIGFINALGIEKIRIIRKPLISLIITGNELQAAGSALEKGKIYESNKAALQTVIKSMGLDIVKIIFVKDDKDALRNAIALALSASDLLLISGGISVGDYDFVSDVLHELNSNTLFYKVAQKPGKPLYFGKNDKTYIFGLPGNPASALTCFYEYVFPAIRKLQGRQDPFLKTLQLPVSREVKKKKGLAHFMKAKVGDNTVEPLEGQESFIIKSFTDANAFIYLSEEKENIKAGEIVEAHLLPEL
jgi:molybdopterin molybdotransferase